MKPMKLEYGKETLSLVLDGDAIIEIEKKLKKSLFSIMVSGNGNMRMPQLGEISTILHCANQAPNIKLSDMGKLYDEYVKNGGDMLKLLNILQELMSKAGFFPSETEDQEKNLTNAEEEEISLV